MAKFKKQVLFLFGFLFGMLLVFPAHSWSNGGWSSDPTNPKFGTHDWIAQHALDWLPTQEKQFVLNNLATYLYGTELPDNPYAPDGIGDTRNHHVYYHADGSLQDDSSAARAQQEQDKAISLFRAGDLSGAAKWLGAMTHYISDVAVFGHVMGSSTDWGSETHHSDYEDYVNGKTSSYGSEFSSFLAFDGTLDNVSAYDATLTLAYNTTFGTDGNGTCVWMDQNYNWADPTFKNRCGESLNLATNAVVDALYTSSLEMSSSQPSTLHVVINEIEQNPPGSDYGTEWVELFNPTTSPVNVGGWTLSTTADQTITVTISQGTSIQPYGYGVYTYYTQWLDNVNECVILRDASQREVDRTPVLSDSANDDYSWSRYPNGVDTDSSADWNFQLSTKGTSNGKVPSSISCNVNPSQIAAGSVVTVSGLITPLHNAALVEIALQKPNGSSVKRSVATDPSGSYEDLFFVDQDGTWTLSASWQGDYDHEQAQSATAQFYAQPGDVYPPVTTSDYDGLWHTTDFTVILTATDDFSGVNETFCRVDSGPIQNVSIGGQPTINTEGGNNTLEYWSSDNFGREETHHLLTGIKLDKTPPSGSFMINNGAIYTNSTSVTLIPSATAPVSGIQSVRFSNDGIWDTEPWEPLSPSKSWILAPGDGNKTVYFQLKDNAGLASNTYANTIVLDTASPSIMMPLRDPNDAVISNQPVKISVNATDFGSGIENVKLTCFTNKSAIGMEFSMSLNQTNGLYECTIPGEDAGTLVKYQITAYDNVDNSATNDNAGQFYVYTVIPEFQSFVLVPLFIIATLLAAIFTGENSTKWLHRKKREL